MHVKYLVMGPDVNVIANQKTKELLYPGENSLTDLIKLLKK